MALGYCVCGETHTFQKDKRKDLLWGKHISLDICQVFHYCCLALQKLFVGFFFLIFIRQEVRRIYDILKWVKLVYSTTSQVH